MASSWRNIQDEDDDEEEEFRPEVCAPLRHSPRTPAAARRTRRAPPDPDPNDARPRGGVPTFLPPSSDDRGLTERPPPAPQPPQSDRESIVFLIDASPAMFRPAPASIAASGDNRVATHTTAGGSSRSFVDVAVDCARSVLRSRIVSTPNDRQGVAFFATTNARGTADDAGAGAGGGARENVWVEQRMNVPSARRIQDLADLVGADGNRRLRDKIGVEGGEENTDGGDDGNRTRDGVASYYDALLRAHHVAREMLNDHAPGAKVRKRLLLFTNRDAPLAGGTGEDGRELISAWREFRDVHRIDVTLYSLPYTTGGDGYSDFDPSVFYENLTARDDDDDEGRGANPDDRNPEPSGRELVPYAGGHELVACFADRIDGLSATFQKKSRKRRRVRTASLRFGSDENDAIAVALFAPAAEAKKPKAVNVHAKDLTELHAETRHIASADGAYVSRENLTRRFVDLGDSAGRAILTPADVADARRACDREGIHLLGFRPRGAIGRWARTSKPARLMVPEEESRQAGSTAAFTALCEAMVAKDRVAIAAYARTDDRFAGVRCVALVPCVEAAEAADDDDDDANDLKIIGLHVVDLPYLDDVRHPELAHATGGVVAGPDAIAAAEAAIEANRVDHYSPLDVPNPSLSRHYRALEIQALDRAWTESDELEAGDVTKPPDAAELEKLGIKEKMIAFKAAVYGTNHDAEALEDAAAGPGVKRSGAGAGKLGSGLGQTLADIDFRALAAANDLERVTVAKLKEFCAANGLAVGGAKAALCERIKDHLLG